MRYVRRLIFQLSDVSVRQRLSLGVLDVSAGQAFFRIFIGFMALGLFVGVAALGAISTRAVVERRQQIGVLRAIGYKRRMIALSFLLESSFVSLLGSAIGVVLGLLLSYNAVTDIRAETGISGQGALLPRLHRTGGGQGRSPPNRRRPEPPQAHLRQLWRPPLAGRQVRA